MNEEVRRVIMAVGSHADDLEIDVGATLLKYHDLGYEIVYVMSTNNMSGSNHVLQEDGSITTTNETPVDMMARRKRECDDAAKVLSTTPIHLDHPQGGYNTGHNEERVLLTYGCALPEGILLDIPSILIASKDDASVQRLADLILEKDAECVMTHSPSDTNIEHCATSLLVTTAFWQAVEKGYEGGLLFWNEGHTLNGDFYCRWDTYIDGTGYLDRKMELLGLHRCQKPNAHFPKFGQRLLCEWRGKLCGCEMAELFIWVRRPVRRSAKVSGVASAVMGEFTAELMQNSR
ncbi:MAG: PIG-L family deacetylase [Abditibacteriaceae bacterium]